MHFKRGVLAATVVAAIVGIVWAKDDLATFWVRERLEQMVGQPVALDQAQVRLGRHEIELKGLRIPFVQPPLTASVDIDRFLVRFDMITLLKGRLKLGYVGCDIAQIEVIREAVPKPVPIGTGEGGAPSATGEGGMQKSLVGTAQTESAAQLPIERLDLRIDRVRYQDKALDADFQQIPLHYAETFEHVDNPRALLQRILQKPIMGKPLSEHLGWKAI